MITSESAGVSWRKKVQSETTYLKTQMQEKAQRDEERSGEMSMRQVGSRKLRQEGMRRHSKNNLKDYKHRKTELVVLKRSA